eukprot:Sdes_comp15987_c0_seq1m5157
MKKEAQQENSVTVQLTNDACTTSKRSMIRRGYFQDEFVSHFVKKPTPRSPLINRVYAVRAYCIEHVIDCFIQSFGVDTSQIVVLGAGFDTLVFRKRLHGGKFCPIYEFDLPDVVSRKSNIILNDSILSSYLEEIHYSETDFPVLTSKKYSLISCDLRSTESLENRLQQISFNFSTPTLIIDECAITYLDPQSSTKLLKWISASFAAVCFFSYTQIRPNDAFGRVMTRHFKKIQSP